MPKLLLIPTPIGNLDDVSPRVREALANADVLLAEDTRHTGKLLSLLGLKNKMVSYHKFNEHRQLEHFIDLIQEHNLVGLVSDAGTPGISDPGFLLVKHCVENEIEVECLPGPTAFVPALVVSGLPCDRFCFEGFLPVKKGRKKRLESLKEEKRTMVFYESPYRIGKCLEEFAGYFGSDRQASVSRELSKKFEETRRADLKTLAEHFSGSKNKGEFVVVVEGKKEDQDK
ncbi:MAG TPA: 16S rRNA (cytidine(1402)-2'-O)-methyltransferase [Flavobacteriales bacterium]|nr:16S rRNA (cytidine(1402)-2'-O)-methyltransferase [Flavobacteriales bacterium]